MAWGRRWSRFFKSLYNKIGTGQKNLFKNWHKILFIDDDDEFILSFLSFFDEDHKVYIGSGDDFLTQIVRVQFAHFSHGFVDHGLKYIIMN